MYNRPVFLFFLLICSISGSGLSAQKGSEMPRSILLDKVWAGHPVGFDLLTTEKYQYAAYYNAERQMIVARRSLGSDKWQKTELSSVLGWDSHNYVTLAIDRDGFLHVSGNMHGVPLIYFRSAKPWETDEFEQLPMTGRNEERVTYPVFFKDHSGDLYFQYRNGGSGDGITYWNRYDAVTKKWESLFETPIFDGEKEANAYMTNPVLGPDGYFYIVWMWRLTPVANTNHNLSCMRSKDLRHWENMKGDSVRLPVKWSDDLTIVDPVGPWNGLINMGFNISWDTDKTPYITYHKYDQDGISQVFIARWETGSAPKGRWNIHRVSQWKDFKWSLNKRGSITNSIWISKIRPVGTDAIAVNYHHEANGDGSWALDKASLQIKKSGKTTENTDLAILPQAQPLEGMAFRHKSDDTGAFVMRWQTLPTNQDRPRPGPAPTPVELVIYQIR